MTVNQRDIVEVSYQFPDGEVLAHPVIVISNIAVHEIEGIFYGVLCSKQILPEEFALELTADMVTKPLRYKTFVKTHMIQAYALDDIMGKHGAVTKIAFDDIKKQIIASIFDTV